MTNLTNTAKPFPWIAIARFMGVTLVMLAKATWWLAKRIAIALGAVLGAAFIVCKAVAEVCMEDDKDAETNNNESMYAEEGELGMDENDQTSFNGANRLKVL